MGSWPVPSNSSDEPSAGPVRAFLIESERRVIMDCRKLLERENLANGVQS